MIYLRDGLLPWEIFLEIDDLRLAFEKIKQAKTYFHDYIFGKDHYNGKLLKIILLDIFLELLKKIDSLEPNDIPQYQQYIHMLIKLLDSEKELDWKMDWSITSEKWDNSFKN